MPQNRYLLIIVLPFVSWLCPVWGVVVSQELSFHAQGTLQSEWTRGRSNSIPSTPSMTVKARPTTVYRPHSIEALHRARLRSLHLSESEALEWDPVEVLGPDVEDRHTLSQLARMSGNAYALPGQKNWYEVDMAWNKVGLSRYLGSHHR